MLLRCLESKLFLSSYLSNGSHAGRVDREVLLLLVRIRAGRSVDLLPAVPMGCSILLRVVRDGVL